MASIHGKRLTLQETVETIKTWLACGENTNETARRLGLNAGTIHSRLNTARAKQLIKEARRDPSYLDDLIGGIEDRLLDQYHTISKLQMQVESLQQFRQVHTSDIYDDSVKIGIVSDVHKGSLYHQADLLELAYDVFEREGIREVYSPGDVLAGGKMYRGQEFELFAHGVDQQVDLCVNTWPEKPGIVTKFITGNHDLSFYKNVGIDPGKPIAARRSDMVYLGREEADIIFDTKYGKARMRLVHPGKGTAYALSYHPQKYIEALEGGKKPHIVVMGHYHKAEMLPSYRNVALVQAGCIEAQTPFMRRNHIAAAMGFWILEFSVNESKMLSRFGGEFVSWFATQSI